MTDREKINTVAMAIAKLQAAGDIAIATGCELAKIPSVDALEIADLLERMIAKAAVSARNVGNVQTEIVRCKDCKYWHDPMRCLLDSEGLKTPDDWFCADGERR